MAALDQNCEIINYTKGKLPSLSFVNIKNAVLGKKYSLSIMIVGATRAQSINSLSRKKEYIPNVLSFPTDNTSGELLLCPKIIEKEAKQQNLLPLAYMTYLYIHGLLHLKGFDHGSKMDREEKRYLAKFTSSKI